MHTRRVSSCSVGGERPARPLSPRSLSRPTTRSRRAGSPRPRSRPGSSPWPAQHVADVVPHRAPAHHDPRGDRPLVSPCAIRSAISRCRAVRRSARPARVRPPNSDGPATRPRRPARPVPSSGTSTIVKTVRLPPRQPSPRRAASADLFLVQANGAGILHRLPRPPLSDPPGGRRAAASRRTSSVPSTSTSLTAQGYPASTSAPRNDPLVSAWMTRASPSRSSTTCPWTVSACSW